MKKKSSTFLAAFLLLVWSTAFAGINDGLVAYYPLDGDAIDGSGYENHGVVYGAVPTEDRFGTTDGAYLFNGVDAYIEVPDSLSLNPDNGITIAAWIKTSDLGTNRHHEIVQKEGTSSGYLFSFQEYGTQLAIGINSDTAMESDTPIDSLQIADGQWHLVVGSYDGILLKVYLDGRLVGSKAQSGPVEATGTPLFIGSSRGIAEFFNGAIDDLRIYNRALTPAEIAELFTPPSALPRYPLGTIPDQTVRHDGMAEFLVHWDNDIAASFTVDVFPMIAGTLTIESFQGPDWLFIYTPAPADKLDFTVTLSAMSGGQVLRQSFRITPQPVLPPEQSVFGMDRHTKPVAISTHDISVFDRESLLPETLNYQTSKSHSIRIVGETVEIEEGHGNGLYEAYCNGDRRDIKQVEIIAEKLIIRSPVRLKQTNVTIVARELRFEGNGRIKTTPEEKTESPGTDANGGLPGADGLKAGNVTLNIGSLHTDTQSVRFDLTGGKGQPGGPGQHGVDGADFTKYWSSFKKCDSGSCATYTPPPGYYIVFWKFTIWGVEWGSDGVRNGYPGDGTDAKPSGKPGEGGAGGMLASNVDVSGLITQGGASSGQPSYPTSWPYSHYEGGKAGQPQKSVKVHFYLEYYIVYWTMKYTAYDAHESKAGANADVKVANAPNGPNGAYTRSGSPYAWLHPLMLRKVLNHAKDDYLGSRVLEAEMRLKDFAAAIDGFMVDASWQNLDMTTRFEIEEIRTEMEILLQRIENSLDYYGNPAGWVPMLSFEVNTTIFNNEIDRAMDMLYLAYWIKNKAISEQQKVDALAAARNQMRKDIAQAKIDYDKAVARLPVLKNKAGNLDTRIKETQFELQIKENELLQQTMEPAWLFGLRLGLKGAGMITQMIPVYQPALGALGSGMSQLGDLNFDAPWDSIIGGADITSTFLESGFDSAASGQKNAKDGIDPNQIESKKFDYLGAMQTASKGLTSGLKDIRGFLKEREAPSAEMLAKLEELKSKSPEYQALLKKIEDLLVEKRTFTDEVVNTMQQIVTLSDLITRNMLAIDAMNRQIAAGEIVLDERATAYLDDMERRAYDRLLKYHYYMAKAYEYRLLKPYTEPLNLKGLIAKFQEIAALNANHEITPAQFNAFKAVYREKLALVAETIFDQYNANRPELSVPVRFDLTNEEIAKLNNGETIPINLMKDGFFFPYEENIRIVNLKIFSMTTEPVGGGYGSSAFVDLKIRHAGISNIKSNGAIYQFRHYNSATENPFVWGGRYDPVDNKIDPIRPSDASDSLLRSLLSGDAVSDMLLYSRPSAWADLNISRSVFDSSGREIKIKSVRLELVFDFTPRNDVLGLKDLEILVTTATPSGGGGTFISESNFMPYFILDTLDVNGRQDALGRFLRIFEYSSTPVMVTAPNKYGIWRFNKWTDRFGKDLTGGPYTATSIGLTPMADWTVCAQYIPLSSADLNLDGDVDGKDLAEFMLLYISEDDKADLNHDGNRDLLDIEAFAEEFGTVE